ncbi:hypothetical protein GW7_10312 [Heterocephalus glaber]|uniref:Uncharacterized protein n=1 Tax=Heterocephalus glaber TaxID=10181 RepID=G5B8L8_HETGA|nr:hypothetical protein GW7_10312 [Heterocephalus glaber]
MPAKHTVLVSAHAYESHSSVRRSYDFFSLQTRSATAIIYGVYEVPFSAGHIAALDNGGSVSKEVWEIVLLALAVTLLLALRLHMVSSLRFEVESDELDVYPQRSGQLQIRRGGDRQAANHCESATEAQRDGGGQQRQEGHGSRGSVGSAAERTEGISPSYALPAQVAFSSSLHCAELK